MNSDSAVRSLARQIAALRREMRAQARAAQGAHRSVDVGVGGTTYYAEDGTPMLQVGVGIDGEFGLLAVDPSVPPVPTDPVLVPAVNGINIIWDGTFEDANWTSNMSHVEVHASLTPDFEATDSTQISVFSSTSGGEFFYATPNDSDVRYVAFVSVSMSGVESAKSLEASAAGLVASAEVVAALSELAADVLTNSQQIDDNATSIDNLALTTQTLVDQTASWDGRVSTSDYDPGQEDVTGRTDGSIWFTRTRARVNYCTNPSFEVNTTGWTGYNCSISRVASSPAVDGAYALQIVNDGTGSNKYVETPQTTQVASPDQVWTGSFYAMGVSGLTTSDYYAQIVFFDSGNIALSSVDGAFAGLSDTSWTRFSVTATAPANTAYVTIRAMSSSANTAAVWKIDGVLLETQSILGAYFDGSSYDCVWGTPTAPAAADNSISTMIGGKITNIFELDDNAWVAKVFANDTLVDLDASAITHGVLDGGLIEDRSIPIDKMSGTPVQAFEALTAGDLVNVYNNGGLFMTRKADADGKECDGFVLENVDANGTAYVYSWGYNPILTGLTPGPLFLSNTAGKPASTPAQTTGQIVQCVGTALGPTAMNFVRGLPIYLT